MKKLVFPVFIILFLFSCKKDSPTNTTTSVSYLTSMVSTHYDSSSNSQDSTSNTLTYDANNNLVHIKYYSSYGTSVDSGSHYFYFKDNDILPRRCTTIYRKYFYTSANISVDTLIYDRQNRLIEDSTLSGYNASANIKYIYAGNTIYVHQSNGYSSYIGNDTIILSNGNVRSVSFGIAYTDSYSINSYTSYPNPFYNPELANTLGVLFTDGNWFDALSKNFPNYGLVPLTTDAYGRIVKLGNNVVFKYK